MAPKDRVKYTGTVGEGKLTWPHSQDHSLRKAPAHCPHLTPAAPGWLPSSVPHVAVSCPKLLLRMLRMLLTAQLGFLGASVGVRR